MVGDAGIAMTGDALAIFRRVRDAIGEGIGELIEEVNRKT